MNIFTYDFGYSGPWDYGHLIAAGIFAVTTVIAWRRGWPAWIKAIPVLLTLWGISGYAIVQYVLRINLPLELPTQRFLADGPGRVLDAGAGSGRSALMVLQARPGSRVVALDLYSGYFGITGNTPERLYANAGIAGVADRVEAVIGDMRSIPLPGNTLDAAVSAYAIDHLDQEGIEKSFEEIRRVIRPGGEFLLMVINNDAWIHIAFPFFIHHGYFRYTNAERWASFWTEQTGRAGFKILETGTRPATLYIHAQKPVE